MCRQRYFLIVLLLWGAGQGFAQTPADLVRQLTADHGAQVRFHTLTDQLTFALFPPDGGLSLPGPTVLDKATSFWQQYGPAFGLPMDSTGLQFLKEETDVAGNRHLYYLQYYRGVPVFDGDLRLHFSADGRLQAAQGQYLPDLQLDADPAITLADAGQRARLDIRKTLPELSLADWQVTASQLMVYHPGLAKGETARPVLAYELTLTHSSGQREFVYVDAHSGTVVDRLPGSCSALDRRVYQGDTGTQVWQEGDPVPGSLNTYEENLVNIGAETYYFFWNAFGRDSYDGIGATMRAVSDASLFASPNANWNGITTNFYLGTEVDDVIAHEWGHAYTEYTCALIYAWQAGAINEALSDIWGETVDLLNSSGNDLDDDCLRTTCGGSLRWKVGEDASPLNGPIRDMWDPTIKNDPGKASDTEYYCSTGDFGGVHTNSGVVNHAYALLVDGGTYHSETVAAIGLTKAAHVFWQAQRYYLTRTSDFPALADALEAAATSLVGFDLPALGITAASPGSSGEMIDGTDLGAVATAITAVELRTDPGCNYSALLDATTPDLCTDPGQPLQMIYQEDFESVPAGWVSTEHPEVPATWDARSWERVGSLPDGRPGMAYYGPDPYVGNCVGDLDNGMIRLQSPVIHLPGGTSADLVLSFTHYVSMENLWDGGNLKYRRNGGTWTLVPQSAFLHNAYNTVINGPGTGNDNPLAGERGFTGADGGSVSGSWGVSQVDLALLGFGAGDDLELRWELGTDGCNGWDGWYIDDVEIVTCTATALPVEWLAFTARAQDESVALQWTTAREWNNAGFWVERSTDGQQFAELAWVAARGDDFASYRYQWNDSSVTPGLIYYYRLRQQDYDASFTYSTVEKVQMSGREADRWQLAPNPAHSGLTLLWTGPESESVTITAYPLLGQQTSMGTLYRGEVTSGQAIQLSVEAWPAGLYLLAFNNGREVVYQRLVVH
ncbi:MAG: M4 family metallopeptidase [Lewinella sp.]|nr:M4 family metallopeptidase [Lewinella sp.]